MFRDFLRSGLAVVGIAFILHYAWETLHLSLYTNYGTLGGQLPITLYATIGDVLYTLLAWAFIALYKRDVGWTLRARAADFVALALLGLCVAMFVEFKALFLHRWEYTHAMPTVFGLGVSPLLQMAILLPLSVYLTRVWYNKVYAQLQHKRHWD